jgi:hypothetical protein
MMGAVPVMNCARAAAGAGTGDQICSGIFIPFPCFLPFCNGSLEVNPFLPCPLAGVTLLSVVGKSRQHDGV